MVKDLIKFYEKVDIKDKTISIYEDEEGNYSVLPTSSLLVSVDYNEFEKEQYKVAEFNGDIPKEFKVNIKKTKKVFPKYELTKKQEDKYILSEKEVDVKQVWFIINGLKLRKAYNNKDEALKEAKKINEKILNKLIN